ncbi:MAG: hypothetical protein D6754_12360 [Alphaproteobacteria bacterium]|nr:MAG: hypothetical protein D6754_12360 [Alphaproteobacteria bacterium]
MLTAMPALAADVALVIANTRYDDAKNLPATVQEGAERLVKTLNAAGYEVYSGRNLDAREMKDTLEAFAEAAGDARKIVIYYAGNPLTSARSTWLTASNLRNPTLITAAERGVELDLLMTIARQARRGAVVAVERGEKGFDPAPPLKDGIGPVSVPKGVFYLEAPAKRFAGRLARTLLAPGVTAKKAVAEYGGRITVRGDVPEKLVFGPARAALDADRQREIEMKLTEGQRLRIQIDLTVLGFDPDGVDGIIGPRTRNAIARWQEANGQRVTGYLGPKQFELLKSQAKRERARIRREAEQRRREFQRQDRAYWQATGASGKPEDLRAYLRRYPDGQFAKQARSRLASIQEERLRQARQAERAAWQAAVRADTVAAYRKYLSTYNRGLFAPAARARIEDLQEAAKLEAQRRRAAARERALGLSPASRVAVERRLRSLGLDAGPADGVFDYQTRSAIRAFQRWNGIAVTGFMNRPTLNRLVAQTN